MYFRCGVWYSTTVGASPSWAYVAWADSAPAGPVSPASSVMASAASSSCTVPSSGWLALTSTVYPTGPPLTSVTSQPCELPLTPKSDASSPSTGSLKMSPNGMVVPPVGLAASALNELTVGGVVSWLGPVVAAIRLATRCRSCGNVG